MPFNLLDHRVYLSPPQRIAVSSWKQHVPFGMLLIDLLRPRLVVELGAHAGVSYCAFCQAVTELQLDTRCVAIDSWEGDPQAGAYGPDILADLHTMTHATPPSRHSSSRISILPSPTSQMARLICCTLTAFTPMRR